jgi:hypothetical protein
MEPDDIVLEYLRGKLKKAQGGRADAILKPPVTEVVEESPEMAPEDLAQLEALAGGGEEMGEVCAECGASGGCDCMKE